MDKEKKKIDLNRAIVQLLMDKYYRTHTDKNIGFHKWSDGFEEWLEYNNLIKKNEDK